MLAYIFQIKEPQWWIQLLKAMNWFVNNHYILTKIVPLTSDVFVFSYPIYLSALYLYGIYKKDVSNKEAALYIFFSSVWAVAFNIFLQSLIYKERPEQIALLKEDLIFSHVPDRPFPSDHAALSATIAMSTLLYWIKSGKRHYIFFSIIFWIFSITLSISRIAAWVHWPTDILIWTIIWIMIPLLLIKWKIYKFLQKKIFSPLIKLQKILFKKIFGLEE